MNIESLNPNYKKLAAIVGGSLGFLAAVLFLDGSGGSASSNSLSASVNESSSDFDVDVCSFLTAEDIETATGIANMQGHDEGPSSGTGSRVCQFDTGIGMLPTVTVWARPADEVPLGGEQATFLDYARENYAGSDLAGVGDGAYIAGGHVYVEKGGVVAEISTLVMKRYLPGKIEGATLVELARAAADNMPAATGS